MIGLVAHPMSSIGKITRLGRLFAHSSGRILTVAVDHMINYPDGFPDGLRDLGVQIDRIVEGEPHALTMNKGSAIRFMGKHAGRVPFIIQSSLLRPGESHFACNCTPDEAVAMGADGIAVAMFVHCPEEIAYAAHLASVVRDAERVGLPVVPHIYPLSSGDERHTVAHDPEAIFYAARVGLEMGADIIKVPFTGEAKSFGDIVSAMPVPVVAAGGPKASTIEEAEAMMQAIAEAGAAGATVGRNVWGFDDPAAAVRRLKVAMGCAA